MNRIISILVGLALLAGSAIAQISGAGSLGCTASVVSGSTWDTTTTINSTQTLISGQAANNVIATLSQTTTLTAGAVTFQVSYDGNHYVNPQRIYDAVTGTIVNNPYTLQANTNRSILIPTYGVQSVQLVLTTVISGSGSITPSTVPVCTTPPNSFLQSPQAVQPSIVQTHSAVSSGSVASLANTFTNPNQGGNTIVVVFANGNANNPAAPISDSNSNTYTKATQLAYSTTVESEIWYATNAAGGANTVTVTPGGTNASIASTVYELAGTFNFTPGVVDLTSGGVTGGSTSFISSAPVVNTVPNDIAIFGLGLADGAQTITINSPFTNDSGQQNPSSPSNLYSFVAGSYIIPGTTNVFLNGSVSTNTHWVNAIALFRPPTPAVYLVGPTAVSPNNYSLNGPSNPFYTFVSQGPTFPTIYTGQQSVTTSAVALAAQGLQNGMCIKALSTNSISVFVGRSSVTTSTGYELTPTGDQYCAAVNNADFLYVIAASGGASVTWIGN